MMHLASERKPTTGTPAELALGRVETPIGSLVFAVGAEGRLCAAGFTTEHPRMQDHLGVRGAAWPSAGESSDGHGNGGEEGRAATARVAEVASALRRYFDGDPTGVDHLLVAPAGTPFQLEVWRAMRDIPFGATCTYGELARRIGRPAAVRAIGLACGANPVGLVVPCHRVVGANGKLTGYGAGLPRKRWLLAHEANARAARDGLLLTL